MAPLAPFAHDNLRVVLPCFVYDTDPRIGHNRFVEPRCCRLSWQLRSNDMRIFCHRRCETGGVASVSDLGYGRACGFSGDDLLKSGNLQTTITNLRGSNRTIVTTRSAETYAMI